MPPPRRRRNFLKILTNHTLISSPKRSPTCKNSTNVKIRAITQISNLRERCLNRDKISSILISTSRWMCISASAVVLSSPMVVLRYVFSRRNEENDRSAVAVETGSVAKTCKKNISKTHEISKNLTHLQYFLDGWLETRARGHGVQGGVRLFELSRVTKLIFPTFELSDEL